MFVESGQTPPDPLIGHKARTQSLSTLGASFLSATPTSSTFVQPQVWRVLLSLHLRLSIHDNTILPLYCRHCHTTVDSEGDHATLNCRHPVAGYFGMRISRFSRETVCARAGLNYAFEVPMLIPQSDKRLVICLHTWRRHTLRTLSRAIPRWTSPSGLHASLRVGGMRRRSLEDRLDLLSTRSAITLRKSLRLQPLRQAPLSRLYHGTSRR
jgi:hypothetical protein